jgi:hypothetical protein
MAGWRCASFLYTGVALRHGTVCGRVARPGAIAQLVEHLHGMQGVRGSSPLSSTLKAFFELKLRVGSTVVDPVSYLLARPPVPCFCTSAACIAALTGQLGALEERGKRSAAGRCIGAGRAAFSVICSAQGSQMGCHPDSADPARATGRPSQGAGRPASKARSIARFLLARTGEVAVCRPRARSVAADRDGAVGMARVAVGAGHALIADDVQLTDPSRYVVCGLLHGDHARWG